MDGLKLYTVKKVEIVVGGEHLKFVKTLLDDVRVSGYTIIPNISGKGHSGFHEGHLMIIRTQTGASGFSSQRLITLSMAVLFGSPVKGSLWAIS